MRAAILMLARTVLLAGPTALAFASGGYFDEARLIAAIAAWALVAIAAVAAESPGGRAIADGLHLLARARGRDRAGAARRGDERGGGLSGVGVPRRAQGAW